jgi:ankyrin repeat protein
MPVSSSSWVVALVLATTEASEQDQARIDLEQAARGVVSVEAKIGDRTLQGAGVVTVRLRDSVIVVTANHVVRQGSTQAGEIVVRFKDKPQRALVAKLLSEFDKADDLAVFQVDGLHEQGVEPCALPAMHIDAPQVVRRGHGVYPIGNPAGVAWRVPAVSDTVTDVGERNITFQSAVIDSGHSGGGLFNAFGDLVGIIRADQPPYGVATPAARAWALLRAGAVPLDACAAARGAAQASSAAPDSPATPATTPAEWMAGYDTVDIDNSYALFRAIQAGQVDTVRRLVKPTEPMDGYHPPFPLHWAAALGQAEVVKQLLLMGLKKNDTVWAKMPDSPYGDMMGTPLHAAARANQVAVMKVLIRAGATLDADVGQQGLGTPLATAARYGRLEAAQVLVDAGANLTAGINYSEPWGTPMAEAAAHGHIDMIKLLLRAKAPLADRRWDSSQTALIRAAVKFDQLPMLRFLASIHSPMECSAISGCETAIFETLADNKPEALKVLLDAGANPNAATFKPYLELAIELQQPRSLQLLLKAGANPNARNRDGQSMLALALAADDNNAIAALRAFGAKR